METNQLVGPNNCKPTIQPEELQLSCSVTYRGNIHPVMEWKSSKLQESLGEYDPFGSVGNNVTYMLKLKADLHMNGVYYTCYTTRSSSAQYNCSSNTISVKYAFSNYTTVNVSVDDRVDCSANTSDKCDYKWKRFTNGSYDLDSCNKILYPRFSGLYVCHIECDIKKRPCSFPVMTAYVTEKEEKPPDSSLGTELGSVTGVLLVVALVVAIFTTLYIRKLKNASSKENEKGLFVEFRPKPQEDTELRLMPNRKLIKTIETTASKEQGLAIYGLTVLDDELYLITCSCSEVEVYAAVPPFKPKHSFSLRTLSSPYDITSCNEHKLACKCLYICLTVQKGKAFISRHDKEGKHQNHWKIADRGFLSVTQSHNILLTLQESKEFIEYKPNGDQIRQVNVGSNLSCPIHVITITDEKFIVCHGAGTERSGGVSIGSVSEDRSLRPEPKHFNELQSPMHMTLGNRDYILVSDPFSNRIVLLNPNLEKNRDLVTGEDGMKFPYKLHLDRSNHRLFVVDNDLDLKDIISNGRVLVFDLSDPLVRFSDGYC